MHAVGRDVWEAQCVDLAWDEPWGRLLDGRLVDRLADAARRGRTPAASDCHEFVAALAPTLRECCDRPLLCRFHETTLPVHGAPGDAAAARGLYATDESILFILSSGAVAFARQVPAAVPDLVVSVLVTAYFPRQAGWVVAKRAAAASAERYVQRWSQTTHRSGGRLLPEPSEVVLDVSEDTGVPKMQGRFRFISPESWGFRRHADGEWVRP